MSARDLLRYLAPFTPAFTAAAIAMIADAIVTMASPWPLKYIVDSVVFQRHLPAWLAATLPDPHGHRIQLLGYFVAAAIILGIADALLTYIGNRTLLRAGQHAIFGVRRDLFGHLQRLSIAFHRGRRSGEIMTRLGGDVQTLQDFVVFAGGGLFGHLFSIVGMFAIMLAVDWRFALVVGALVPPLFITAFFYTRRLRLALRRARSNEGELWGMVQESIAGIHVVQAFGREDHERARFLDLGEKSLDSTLEASQLQAQFPPLVDFIMSLSLGLTLWFGGLSAVRGEISPGELLVFLAYLRAIATPIRQLAKIAGSAGKAAVALERIGDVFAEQPQIVEEPGAFRPPGCVGALEYKSVVFSYFGNRNALSDVSFRVDPGQTVAIVGPTGAGKSTLVSLVARFHDPSRGSVLLDGRDLRDLSLAFVRSQVGWVLQESLVFHGTVWENIAFGRPGAGRNDAIAAARAAGVDTILASLADGYDTMVGERGATLSGGQRQCVAIARAMLRDARIVVLDEATSGLDPLIERDVVAAIDRLREGRTTLVIAHRLATITRADSIVMVDGGRIVAHGTHDELLRSCDRYKLYWECSNSVDPHETRSLVSLQGEIS